MQTTSCCSWRQCINMRIVMSQLENYYCKVWILFVSSRAHGWKKCFLIYHSWVSRSKHPKFYGFVLTDHEDNALKSTKCPWVLTATWRHVLSMNGETTSLQGPNLEVWIHLALNHYITCSDYISGTFRGLHACRHRLKLKSCPLFRSELIHTTVWCWYSCCNTKEDLV